MVPTAFRHGYININIEMLCRFLAAAATCAAFDLSNCESFQNLISLLTPVPPSLPNAWRQRVLSTAPERGVSVHQIIRSTTERFFSRKAFSQVARRIPSKTVDRYIATTKMALVQESEFLHLVQERQVQIWEAEETRLGPIILLGSMHWMSPLFSNVLGSPLRS